MPDSWVPMADEYTPTDEDSRTGLIKFLYEARDTAAKAVGNLFSSVGAETDKYIYDMPIGIEEDSDVSGAYDPGVYGIVVGRDSEDVLEFQESNGENIRLRNRVATTMAHEMIHAEQTVPADFPVESFDTVGNTMMGWYGLEESMTEALGNIAMNMQVNNQSLEESARKLEERCMNTTMPATQMAAKLIQKMGPELLKWYLTCAKDENRKSDNKLESTLGDRYRIFLQNMTKLYEHEIDEDVDESDYQNLLQQTEQIIDTKF